LLVAIQVGANFSLGMPQTLVDGVIHSGIGADKKLQPVVVRWGKALEHARLEILDVLRARIADNVLDKSSTCLIRDGRDT